MRMAIVTSSRVDDVASESDQRAVLPFKVQLHRVDPVALLNLRLVAAIVVRSHSDRMRQHQRGDRRGQRCLVEPLLLWRHSSSPVLLINTHSADYGAGDFARSTRSK